MRARWAWALVALGACRSSVSTEPGDGGDGSGSVFGPSAPEIDPFETTDASYPMRVAALFDRSCGGGPETACHRSGAAGLYLVLARDGGDIVDVPSTERPDFVRVKPGDPAHSYLFLKVAGDGGIDGGEMPLDTPFDPRIPALIGDWISAGAAAP